MVLKARRTVIVRMNILNQWRSVVQYIARKRKLSLRSDQRVKWLGRSTKDDTLKWYWIESMQVITPTTL